MIERIVVIAMGVCFGAIAIAFFVGLVTACLGKEVLRTFPNSSRQIVCICGSTRFRKEIEAVNRLETLKGNIVLAPGVFGHSGDSITEEQKKDLDTLHFRKIEISDRVVVVCPDNYIGSSCRSEIGYAESLGKKGEYVCEFA